MTKITIDLVVLGAEIAAKYRLSYWDGAIIAGAPILCTEDPNDARAYGSVRAPNPFKPN